MRAPVAHRYEEDRFDVNMTPMIDVVFQLLIFFVCTTNFSALEELLPTPLRAAGSTAPAREDAHPDKREQVIVKLRRQDDQPKWEVAGRTYDQPGELRNLLSRLVAVDNDLVVILDIDGDAPLGEGIDLYDACRLAGVRHVRFVAPSEAPQ